MCSLALFAAAATLVAVAAPSAVVARQKEKDKKDTKKDDKDKKDAKAPKADESGAIEVYQAKDGWRFRVVGGDGKSVAIGVQGYAKKEDCLAAIEVLKTALAKAKATEPKDEKK
ncbi:MAG: DUF1508 domain-containing protein [Planctomycetes bacterium]|nr:DUF1508 domain-containing protein [Planctomycetota bacterium]